MIRFFLLILICISFPAMAQENQEPAAPLMKSWTATPSINQNSKPLSSKQPANMNGSADDASGSMMKSPLIRQLPTFGKNEQLQTTTSSKETEERQETTKPANLKADYTQLRQMNTVTVEQVIDPLRIGIRGNKIIQLAGIDIPDLDPYEPGKISVEARNFLTALLLNRHVRVYQTKDSSKGRTNRMGYELAHLEAREGDIWVQGALLAAGLARVRPTTRNPEMAAQMVALEDKARTEKKGLWQDKRYDVLTPATAQAAIGDWGVIEGEISTIATIRNKTYLNFGEDWRADFTVGIDSNMRRDLTAAGINVMDLGRRRVRVRGWIESYNGPYLALSHPVWLELLPKATDQTSN